MAVFDLKRDCFIWGTGEWASKIPHYYFSFLKQLTIIGYIDSDQRKQGRMFQNKQIFAPDIISSHMDTNIIIAVANGHNAIMRQIYQKYPDYTGQVIWIRRLFSLLGLNQRYGLCKDPEIEEVLNYANQHGLKTFNYSFTEKYFAMDWDVMRDNSCGLYYLLHEGKKLYFARKYDSEEKVVEYYRSIRIEQDELSPHRYLAKDFKVQKGNIVVDAGAAEGNFSLENIDIAGHIYIFESDEEWIEALKRTFAPYRNKVKIFHKALSNYEDEVHGITTMDLALYGTLIDFLKMDIEGEEYYALLGGEKVLELSPHVKCSICTYHQEFAYPMIDRFFKERGYVTDHSSGYMWYDNRLWLEHPDDFRRGVICAQKAGELA